MTTTLSLLDSHQTNDHGYERLAVTLQSAPPEECIRMLKQFLQTFPSFAPAHNDLGRLYHQTGNQTLALAHHEKATRLQPDNIIFRKYLADFYAVELGWLDDAVDIYLEVLKRNPRDTEALIALGRLGTALEANNANLSVPPEQIQDSQPLPQAPQESIDFIKESFEAPCSMAPLAPEKSFEEQHREAQEAVQAGNLAEARVLFEALIRLQPDNALIQNDLGVICYNLGDIMAAQAQYEAAYAIDPHNDAVARNLADLYFAAVGRADDAIHIYLGLYNKNPRDMETLVNLGHICTRVGRDEEAKLFYRRALEVEPWNREAREALVALTDRPAVQTFQPPAEPLRSAEDLHADALKLVEEGRTEDAASLLKELVQLYPQFALGHNDLGVVCHRLGDIEGAGRAYERAVELAPENSNFRKNLADIYFVELGRTDDAIHAYLELLRAHPRDVEVLQSLGQVSAAVGRPAEAKTFYRRVLEIEPWNRDAREALRLFA